MPNRCVSLNNHQRSRDGNDDADADVDVHGGLGLKHAGTKVKALYLAHTPHPSYLDTNLSNITTTLKALGILTINTPSEYQFILLNIY